MTDRLRCLVPGCRCTLLPSEPGDTEGICSKHWKTTDRRWRSLYRRRRRAPKTDKNIIAVHRVWRVLVRQAIERAVGIA